MEDELKKLASQSVVKLKAIVEAELYEGSFDDIEYFIPGESAREILLVSHFCHPYPGGQENASGPGTLMETMRDITKLIKTGQIPKPQLGIRFLMMSEMTGTAAYFDQHPEEDCTYNCFHMTGEKRCIKEPTGALYLLWI